MSDHSEPTENWPATPPSTDVFADDLMEDEVCLVTGGGSIISMGATNSVDGAPFHGHSGAGKAGVHNLMQTVASEWAKHGVRANTIAPGIIETEGVSEAAGGALPPQLLDEMAADRFGVAEDCVPLAVFLASRASAYVTGSYYAVDGGHLVRQSPY